MERLLVTLISAEGLSQAAVEAARRALAAAGGRVADGPRLDPPRALDLLVDGLDKRTARAGVEAVAPDFDVVVQPAAGPRVKRLLVADMDSTMIGQECIDELADFAGRKAEIAAITARAMQGELDFAAALEARVAALAGLEASAIDRCLAERVRPTPGAATLIATLSAAGCRTLLVSGGFTAFTAPVAAALGFDRQVANRLGIADGRLDGTVARPIVDGEAKRTTLEAERAALGLAPEDTLALGDGANDIPMLRAAGLGIAFRAKPGAAAAADAHLRLGDLTAVLWALGLPRSQWRDRESLSAVA
jgi:phosphoserine phosphatase